MEECSAGPIDCARIFFGKTDDVIPFFIAYFSVEVEEPRPTFSNPDDLGSMVTSMGYNRFYTSIEAGDVTSPGQDSNSRIFSHS